jgi:NAD(P)H-hydrate epimerase
MKPVLSAAEMRAVDEETQASTNISVLIERAGYAVAHRALELLEGAYGRRVVVIAGKGHNGDDGRVAASVLRARGVGVTTLGLDKDLRLVPPCDLVIDAAFGTGFHGSYDAPMVEPATRVLSVDIPSGLSADSGVACSGAVRADATVTFGALKPGLILRDGPGCAGEIVVADIGLVERAPRAYLIEDEDVASLLVPRRRDGHKWDAAVLVVAGSPGMSGAARLVSLGALRSGSGMIRLFSPGSPLGVPLVTEVVAQEIPTWGWAGAVADAATRCKAIVVGPGLGIAEVTKAEIKRLLSSTNAPLVLDADGLNAFASVEDLANICRARQGPIVLTPHDGEFARLTGALPGEDRSEVVRGLSSQTGATVLLKGSTTIVASPSGEVRYAASGTPRLSTAGSGDVLSGVIGAFLARGLDPMIACALGAHVHGRAAQIGDVEGLIASDLPALIASYLGETERIPDEEPVQ